MLKIKIPNLFKTNNFIYIYLYVSLSYWVSNSLNILAYRTIVLVLVFILLYLSRNLTISKNVIVAFLLLIGAQLSTIIFKSYHVSIDFAQVSAVFIAFLLIHSLDFETFKSKYVNFISFIAGFSLITFFLYKAVPSVFNMLPKVKATALTANAFFSLVPLEMSDYFRNFGCFREPGMFQVYLSFALIFHLFSEKISFLRISILCATIITTFSSAAYLTTIIIFLAFFCYRKGNTQNKKYRRRIIYLAIVTVIVVVYAYIEGYFGHYSTVILKFTEFTSGTGSSFERLKAVQLALKTIWDNPLLGCGWGEWAELFYSSGILTCTPLNWFAIYGIIYGIICNIGLLKLSFRLSTDRLSAFFIFLAILMAIFSQDVAGDIIIVAFIFYAYKNQWEENIRNH